MQIFGGVKEVYYGICASSEYTLPRPYAMQAVSLYSPGTEMTDEKAIQEIISGITNRRRSLKRDVDQMCELLLNLRTLFESYLEINPKLGYCRKLFDDGCLAIYWSLKLHLALHCGNDHASGHENLRKLGRSLDVTDLDKVPVEEHAVDPGSKVLEIVSTQFLSSKGAVILGNLCRNLSRNFFATKVPTLLDKFLDRHIIRRFCQLAALSMIA